MKRKVFAKRDWVILAVLVVVAALTLALFALRPRGNIAIVSYNGERVMEINLSRDGIYHIEADYPVTLEVKDGRIRFVDSHCPDHLCEGFSWIGDEYETAICMPARVVVQIASAT